MVRWTGAGALDRRIAIDERVVAQNGFGEETETWSPLVEDLPARYLPQRAGEAVQAAQINAEEMAGFMIRYRTDVTPRMRVRFDGKIYDITGVHEPAGAPRRRYLILEAVARAL